MHLNCSDLEVREKVENQLKNLHIKGNHLCTMHPANQWFVVGGVEPCTLWVNSQEILLRESINKIESIVIRP